MRVSMIYRHRNYRSISDQHEPADLMGYLYAGIARSGHKISQVRLGSDLRSPDVVVTWGWKHGLHVAKVVGSENVLVLERGYMTAKNGDTRFRLSSLAWGGLNGRGSFHAPDDGGERWRNLYGDLPDESTDGDYALVCGQCAGDASLLTAGDINEWYATTTETLIDAGYRVVFRPHPQSRIATPVPFGAEQSTNKRIEDDIAGAKVVVAYNSNSLTDAALAGKQVIAGDVGAMAWPITQGADRQEWAHRMAWTQWDLNALRSGEAWEHILAARKGKAWHESFLTLNAVD